MIKPVKQDDAFLEDVAAADPGDGVAVWWLGQSGFLIKHRDRHLLFDPYLSDSLTRKYAGTDKPHVRMTERVVDPSRLGFVSLVTSTHNHTDHLDAETLGPIISANPDLALVIPEANRRVVSERLGTAVDWPVGSDAGTCREVAGFRVHGVPAAHEAVDRDEAGRCRYLGYIVEIGPWSVYHSGDTMWAEEIVEALRPFDIDIAILPINGRRPERGVPGNLDGPQAASFARTIGARLAIPCHYEMFEFNTEPPDPFVEACERMGQSQRVLRCGERFEMRQQSG